jgi:hypothetical protein
LWASSFNSAALRAGVDADTKKYLALKLVKPSLKGAAINAPVGETWLEFVERLSQIERNQTIANTVAKTTSNTRGATTNTKSNGTAAGAPPKKDGTRANFRTNGQFRLIMQKRVCAGCFEEGHTWRTPNKPCDNQPLKPFSEFEKKFGWVDAATAEVTEEADNGDKPKNE